MDNRTVEERREAMRQSLVAENKYSDKEIEIMLKLCDGLSARLPVKTEEQEKLSIGQRENKQWREDGGPSYWGKDRQQMAAHLFATGEASSKHGNQQSDHQGMADELQSPAYWVTSNGFAEFMLNLRRFIWVRWSRLMRPVYRLLGYLFVKKNRARLHWKLLKKMGVVKYVRHQMARTQGLDPKPGREVQLPGFEACRRPDGSYHADPNAPPSVSSARLTGEPIESGPPDLEALYRELLEATPVHVFTGASTGLQGVCAKCGFRESIVEKIKREAEGKKLPSCPGFPKELAKELKLAEANSQPCPVPCATPCECNPGEPNAASAVASALLEKIEPVLTSESPVMETEDEVFNEETGSWEPKIKTEV